MSVCMCVFDGRVRIGVRYKLKHFIGAVSQVMVLQLITYN